MPDGEDDVSVPAAPPSDPLIYIPRQRGADGAPLPVELSDLPPLELVAGGAPLPLPPSLPLPPEPRARRRVRAGVVVALVVALVGAAAAFVTINRDKVVARVVVEGAIPSPRPLIPSELAAQALDKQAAALLAGDEAGWLAAVDPGQPKLRARYRSMFTTLRALGVTKFEYRGRANFDKPSTDTLVQLDAQIAYCFTDNPCPDDSGVPFTEQSLRLEPVGGAWVISSSSTAKSADDQLPKPWENGDYVLGRGERVTLVAQASERKWFDDVLPIADKAAAVNDRFAGLVDNPQKRYRIYLAGAKQWKSWFGGISDKWVVGYAVPLNQAGTEVVLNMSELADDDKLLETTIQHELGHVVTLGAATGRSWGEGDMWLKEGIAEYIGWWPEPATESWRRQSVHDLLHGSNAPTSIATNALQTDARLEEGDAFYGFGHFAADCLATKYGQAELFTFVRLYLREDVDLDPASRQAFGAGFTTVDKTCMRWIKDRA